MSNPEGCFACFCDLYHQKPTHGRWRLMQTPMPVRWVEEGAEQRKPPRRKKRHDGFHRSVVRTAHAKNGVIVDPA
jgi:hypothetical protein